MDAGNIVRFIRTLVILAAIFAIIGAITIAFDLTSYLATETKSIGPDDATQKALIVYDPGLMGMGKKSAAWMGNGMVTLGYNVTVAGIRSKGVENATDYDAMIVIAPDYSWGMPGVVGDYINASHLNASAIIGIYTVRDILGDENSTPMMIALQEKGIAGATIRQDYVDAFDHGAEERAYAFIYRLLN